VASSVPKCNVVPPSPATVGLIIYAQWVFHRQYVKSLYVAAEQVAVVSPVLRDGAVVPTL
jgi:hypothetical protein